MLMVGIPVVDVSGASLIVLSVIIFIRFLIRSPLMELALGEIFHTIALGVMRLDYASLLRKSGLSPSLLDRVLIDYKNFFCWRLLVGWHSLVVDLSQTFRGDVSS